MATPNMGLVLPVVTVTPGPTYATENNIAFQTIDSHDHTSGNGVPITPAALNINSDLAFNGYNLTNLRSTQYNDQASPLALPTDIRCVYSSGGNLYWNSSAGQQVQITAGGALNASSIGAIGGDYATSSASVFYTSISSTFTFWSAANTPAIMDQGPTTIRRNSLNSFGVTISPSSGIAGNYSWILPSALPASTKIMTIDNSGNIANTLYVDNSTIDVNSNNLRVKPAGITPNEIVAGYGLIPSGGTVPFAGPVANIPSGWLLCDGTSYLIADYPQLAAALFDSGTGNYAWGSADITHFNVPMTEGLFLRGVDNASGNDPDAGSRTATNTGGNTGDNVGSSQSDAFASHAHGISPTAYNNSGGTTYANGPNPINASLGITQASGGNETRPKNVYFNFIIKT